MPSVHYNEDLTNVALASKLLRGIVKMTRARARLLLELRVKDGAVPEHNVSMSLSYALSGPFGAQQADKVRVTPVPIENFPRLVGLVIDPPEVGIDFGPTYHRLAMNLCGWEYRPPREHAYDLSKVIFRHEPGDAPYVVNMIFNSPRHIALSGRISKTSSTETGVSFSDEGFPILLSGDDIHFHPCIIMAVTKAPARVYVTTVDKRSLPPVRDDQGRFFMIKQYGTLVLYSCDGGMVKPRTLSLPGPGPADRDMRFALSKSLTGPTEFSGKGFDEWFEKNGLRLYLY